MGKRHVGTGVLFLFMLAGFSWNPCGETYDKATTQGCYVNNP
jgi:hypothetical protein